MAITELKKPGKTLKKVNVVQRYKSKEDVKEPHTLVIDSVFAVWHGDIQIETRIYLGVTNRELDIINKCNLLNKLPGLTNTVTDLWIERAINGTIEDPRKSLVEMIENDYEFTDYYMEDCE